MLILTSTTDKIQAVLLAAVISNQLNCVASYRDITTTTYTPGRTVINTNGSTDVDVVDGPASGQRVIDHISIFNTDTVAANLTIKFDADGTEYILWQGALAVDERVEYSDKEGFRVFTSNGSLKKVNSANIPISNNLNTVVLSADVVNNNAVANTIADVTGLSFAVTSGNVYWFRFSIMYTSAISTTGSRWSINGPAVTYLAYTVQAALAATTITIGNYGTYNQPAAASATAPADLVGMVTIEGIIKPSANGTVIARFASEVLSSAITAKAGSILNWVQVI